MKKFIVASNKTFMISDKNNWLDNRSQESGRIYRANINAHTRGDPPAAAFNRAWTIHFFYKNFEYPGSPSEVS